MFGCFVLVPRAPLGHEVSQEIQELLVLKAKRLSGRTEWNNTDLCCFLNWFHFMVHWFILCDHL